MIKKLLGKYEPRQSKVIVTRDGFRKMIDAGLTHDILTDVFRHEHELFRGIIMHRYDNKMVGICVEHFENDTDTYLIVQLLETTKYCFRERST